MGNTVKSKLKAQEPGGNEAEEEREQKDQTPTPLRQVKEKLVKANRGNSNMGENELQDLAEKLIDKEKVKMEYFSHLLEQAENASSAVSEEQDSFPRGFPNQVTRTDSEQRMAAHWEQVRKLEVKLILHELRNTSLIQEVATFIHNHVNSFAFGPFHASILIGDVLLEWRPNSLVIPYKIKHVHNEDFQAVLFANLHETSFDEQLPTVPLQYETGTNQDAVAMTFEKIKDITREKHQLIDELADVVVRYNKKMHYGVFTNNCQHFVLDVLTVLGITHPEAVFQGKIKQHADLAMARYNKGATVEFNSHQELDDFIRGQKIDEMSRDDLEFAYCHYLLFHAWGQRFPHEDAWKCTKSDCQANEVARKVQ